MLVTFQVAAFLSAALIFSIEPMIAKRLLPAFGGAPMVWNACSVFFEVVLLAGYAYAWGLARWLSARRQAALHMVVVALGLTVLPFAFDVQVPPPAGWPPVVWLLALLSMTTALPVFALSASAPTLQHWLSRTGHHSGRDPYFLYAASNLGSFGALAAYPFLIEPTLGIRAQVQDWWVGYFALIALFLACAAALWRRGDVAGRYADVHPREAPPVTWRQRTRWLVFAFVPSSLMLSVTFHISTDIAAVPLLWVVPLAIYLFTFVLAFGTTGARWRGIASRALPVLVVPLALFMASQTRAPLVMTLSLDLLAFTAAALVCHGEISAERPAVAHLTEFYFWIALGGLLGGAFNTFVAPKLFTGVVEYPLGLVLACLLRPAAQRGRPWPVARQIAAVAAIALLTIAAVLVTRRAGNDPRILFVLLAVPGIVAFSWSGRRPVAFGLAIGAMLVVGGALSSRYGRVLHAERTFFGVYRVSIDATGRYYELFHGSTLHGMQAADPSRRGEALTYYSRTGPFGQAWSRVPIMSRTSSVAVIGLGVGSLATYARPWQLWTFYEIDPAVERIARDVRYFTHLHNCGAECRVVLGDARQSLAGAAPHAYGLIVLDAFSSDAIPVHLVTSEALDLYLSRLAAGGVLAFHISNRYLSIGPVLARLASAHHLASLEARHVVTDADQAAGRLPSDWLLMARADTDFGSLSSGGDWFTPVAPRGTPLWTDDFSNLVSVLRLH
jgi:hypothetical protein